MDGFPLVHYGHQFSFPFTYSILGNLGVSNLPLVDCLVPSLRFDLERNSLSIYLWKVLMDLVNRYLVENFFFPCCGLSYNQLGLEILVLHIE